MTGAVTEGDDAGGRRALVRRFFRGTGRSYDRVVRLTTLEQDGAWKRRLMGFVPPDARSVLDLACGTGLVTRHLLRRCPRAEITGVDVTPEYLDIARWRFRESPRHVRLLRADAEDVALEGTFDAVVSCYLPKYVDPARLYPRLVPHLAPGAVVAVHDFTCPSARMPRAIWRAYMRAVGLFGRHAFPEWRIVFDAGLADLVARTPWHRTHRWVLQNLGFTDVRRTWLTGQMAAIVSARWPG